MIKKTICLLLGLGLLAACQEKSTTVNPPAEKSESNTTVINKESPPPETKTETKTETNVNVNPSPSP
jgi:hypothetical protein